MTPEDAAKLKPGDRVRNVRNERVYVIMESYAREVGTQITKEEITRRPADFEITS